MKKARKKPVEIEYLTFEDLKELANKQDKTIGCKELDFRGHTIMWYNKLYNQEDVFRLTTLEGIMTMTDKDVLIVGIRGEIYPCKIDIFNETYEVIE